MPLPHGRRDITRDGVKMQNILKKAAAFVAAAVMIVTVSSCGGDAVIGNLGEVKREPIPNPQSPFILMFLIYDINNSNLEFNILIFFLLSKNNSI